MSKDFYQRQNNRVFFQRETATGAIYDPESEITAWIAPDADYAHWRRFDTIPDALDLDVPKISKEKKYDISDAKHPTVIVSGNYEPITFSIDTLGQALEFLNAAIGATTVSSHTRAMVQTIECLAKASISDGDYFLFDVVRTDGYIDHFLVWYDVTGGGSAPTVTGINASNRIEVAIDGDTTAIQVATSTVSAINTASIEVTAANGSGTSATVTLTHDNSGAVQQAHDGAAATDFTFAVTTWGATTYTVTEGLGHTLDTFTIHGEQANDDSNEDIIIDYMGCVVDEVSVDISFENKSVTGSVTFMCPYADTGNKSTNNPPKKTVATFSTMNELKESASNYVLMEGTTDRTPKSVTSISISIKNNIEYKADIGYRYAVFPIATKREITLSITGYTDEKELFQYYREAFSESSGDYIPTSASGRLNSKIKLERDATYDYILMSIYNWLPESHNFVFQSIDEQIKGIEITLSDATPDSNGRIVDSMSVISRIDMCVFTDNSA